MAVSKPSFCAYEAAISFSQAFSSSSQNDILISNMDEFHQAKSSVNPGDQIILRNGIWLDTELVLTDQGTEESLIALSVKEKTLEDQFNYFDCCNG